MRASHEPTQCAKNPNKLLVAHLKVLHACRNQLYIHAKIPVVVMSEDTYPDTPVGLRQSRLGPQHILSYGWKVHHQYRFCLYVNILIYVYIHLQSYTYIYPLISSVHRPLKIRVVEPRFLLLTKAQHFIPLLRRC